MSCSVSKDSKGYRIDYRYRGRKSSLRLGSRVTKRQYDSFALKMASLIEARNLGALEAPLDDSIARWLADLSDQIYSRLHRIGLVPQRRRTISLVRYLDEYFETHGRLVEAADGTKIMWRRATRFARLYFGNERSLQSVTDTDAKKFKIWLLDQKGQEGRKLADATARKMCAIMSQAFREARCEGLIAANPFDRVPKGNVTNPDRERYVSETTIDLLIKTATDPELRILLALSRYGALRLPSESAELRWSDWNEATHLLTVRSPKTKKQGKPSRSIPVSPKLREVLAANKPHDASADDYVLPRLRLHTNPRTCIERLTKQLKLARWPKCFHALRASAISDWSLRYPVADLAKWAGHTPVVALKHYLRAHEGERLVALAKEVAGGTGGGDEVGSVVTPMVASADTTSSPEASTPTQTPSRDGVVTTGDESRLLVGVSHQQAEPHRNGRRGISNISENARGNRATSNPVVATVVATASAPESRADHLTRYLGTQPPEIIEHLLRVVAYLRAVTPTTTIGPTDATGRRSPVSA